MENNKIIITFSDNSISIVVFNCDAKENIILFEKSTKLEKGIIVNGLIGDIQKIYSIIRSMIKESSIFTGLSFKNIYISFDSSKIIIKPIEINDIELKSGFFDKNVWEKEILPKLDVTQNSNNYIYDIVYEEWTVGNKTFNIIDSQIAGDTLKIKANMFQINKVMHSQYSQLFKKLDINIINLKPMINDMASFAEETKFNSHELFTYINDESITIIQTNGKNIRRCVSNEELGFNSLYNMISDNTKLETDYIKDLLHKTISRGSLRELSIVSEFNQNSLDVKEVKGSDIEIIIDSYIKAVVNFVEDNEKYLKEKKNLKIKKTTYVPLDTFTKKLFNLVSISAESVHTILNSEITNEYGDDLMQANLLIKTIRNNDKLMSQSCANMLTKKEIKFLKESD